MIVPLAHVGGGVLEPLQLLPPDEQLADVQPVAPRHRRGGRRRIEALGHDPRLVLVRPAPAPADPEHLAVVPHSPRLNPGSGDFAVEFRMRTTHSFGNVIQKGQSGSAGGYFKLQQPNGKISCLFRGSAGSSTASAGSTVRRAARTTARAPAKSPWARATWAFSSMMLSKTSRPGGTKLRFTLKLEKDEQRFAAVEQLLEALQKPAAAKLRR